MAVKKKKGTNEIAYCKIYPPIGFARVGNSDEFFIGPEATGDPAIPEDGYKDSEGKVKKQAARFRVYGFNNQGKLVREITSKSAEITWSVSVANKKASWFAFSGTKTVQEILAKKTDGKALRNPNIAKKDRHTLEITPPPCTISGESQKGELLQGEFLDYPRPITLGQCLTDDRGRLVFLGGNGQADTTRGKDSAFLISYANNDWWFDDVCDGPVSCKVKIGGKNVTVRGGAWIVVAPPDYSPFTKNLISLYDVFIQSASDFKLNWAENEYGAEPWSQPVSFMKDIYPMLKRTGDLRWVNAKAYQAHGRERLADFIKFEDLQTLADPKKAAEPDSMHKKIFSHVRDPNLDPTSFAARNQANLNFMPALSGDEGTAEEGKPETWLHLTRRQYEAFRLWAQGQFVGDLVKSEKELARYDNDICTLERLPIFRQPLELTKGALDACQGGAFFPGIEMTSVAINKKFYGPEPFRVNESWEPGDLSKWMALPWQADFNDCRENWWPAVRPDDVVTEAYYDDILSQTRESKNADLFRLLVRREKWDRGVGVQYDGYEFMRMPTIPAPLSGMDMETYLSYVDDTLSRFRNLYVRRIPGRREGELDAAFLRRVTRFLSQTIGVPKKNLPTNGDKIATIVNEFIINGTKLEKPGKNERVQDFYQRQRQRFFENVVAQGVFDIVWNVQKLVADKNELVGAWDELAVVSKLNINSRESVLVEQGRDKYARLPWREYFYILMNIENYPDFVEKSRELADDFFAFARSIIDQAEPGSENAFFRYGKTSFDSRLEQIYEDNRKRAARYNPAVDPGFFNTEEKIVERIRQLSPFNQLDGGWLQRVTPAGNASKLQGLLFQIWMDELGNGDPAQNHANVYSDLMRSAGIYYPKIDTKDYAENREIWDEMFSGPVYHTAVSLFPEGFYPEILGMTLYLEWEANNLQEMVELYDYYGYPSLFYKLHVAIDNTVDGHGAMAKKIVELYLDQVRNESGEEGVQEHWERIWIGYIAFKVGGIQKWDFHLNNPRTPRQKIIDMMGRKRHYGSLNHHDMKLGMVRINALFDEPAMFLDELERSDFVVPGDPEASEFIKLTDPDGVMFRIFTKEEIEVWKDWVRSLPVASPSESNLAGNRMSLLLQRMASKSIGRPEHANEVLSGPNPELSISSWADNTKHITESVAWWFQSLRHPVAEGNPEQANAAAFMRALALPENGWIVSGKPERSRLVNELLRNGDMGTRLRKTRPVIGGGRGADVIVEWIREGCPDPDLIVSKAKTETSDELVGKVSGAVLRMVAEIESQVSGRSHSTASLQTPEAIDQRHRRRGPGMGCVQ